jgi:hypothetical protein
LSNVNPTNYFSLAVSSGAGKKKEEIQKTTQQSHNQEITLTNKFQKLPDKLTTKIFSKLEDEPKTLTRCTAVCKNWASFVSETVNLSLRFSSLGNEGHSIPCSKLHYHIPQYAIPSIMNVFANLESFEIKLCNYPSQTSHPSYRQNITKMKVKWDGNVDQAFC